MLLRTGNEVMKEVDSACRSSSSKYVKKNDDSKKYGNYGASREYYLETDSSEVATWLFCLCSGMAATMKYSCLMSAEQ